MNHESEILKMLCRLGEMADDSKKDIHNISRDVVDIKVAVGKADVRMIAFKEDQERIDQAIQNHVGSSGQHGGGEYGFVYGLGFIVRHWPKIASVVGAVAGIAAMILGMEHK